MVLEWSEPSRVTSHLELAPSGSPKVSSLKVALMGWLDVERLLAVLVVAEGSREDGCAEDGEDELDEAVDVAEHRPDASFWLEGQLRWKRRDARDCRH